MVMTLVPQDGEAATAQVVQPESVKVDEGGGHLTLSPALLEVLQPLDVEPVLKDEPETSVGLALIETVQAVLHVPRPNNSHRLYVSPELLAERYAESTLGELGAARAVMEVEVSQLMIDVSKRFLDEGGGETEVRDRPKRDEETGELIMPPGRNTHGLMSLERTEVLPNGQLIVRSGLLPWEGNTSYYDAQDELFWVRREIRRRGKLPATDSEIDAPGETEKH
ncbi:MAG: hypothetical protein ACI9EF_000639 [Pseudohongiellaceae bacterium]|jgi:hypothetical protein